MDCSVSKGNLSNCMKTTYPAVKKHSAWGAWEHSLARSMDIKIREDVSNLIGAVSFLARLLSHISPIIFNAALVIDSIRNPGCYSGSRGTSISANLGKSMAEAAKEYTRLSARQRSRNS